jgi:hypothetical protein
MVGLVSSGSGLNLLSISTQELAKVIVDLDIDKNPLVSEEHFQDIEDFILSYPALTNDYIPISIIGEGKYLLFQGPFIMVRNRYIQYRVQSHRCEPLSN